MRPSHRPLLPALALLLLSTTGCNASNGARCDLGCANGGECVLTSEAASCECSAGYAGALCEAEIDECLGDPCSAVGTCVDEVDGYTCAPYEISIWGDDLTAGNGMGPIVESFGLNATDFSGTSMPDVNAVTLSGDYVVYATNGGGGGDPSILLFRISTNENTQLATNVAAYTELVAAGDYVAWIENDGLNRQVVTYQISTGALVPRTSMLDEPSFLAMEGDTLVWMDSSGLAQGIYGLLLSSSTNFTVRTTTDSLAGPLSLHENVVAHRNFDSGSDVEATILSSDTPGTVDRHVQLSLGLGSCGSPRPKARGVLFLEGLGALGVDTYYYDFASDTAYNLSNAPGGNDLRPAWAGDTPVWFNTSNNELFTYDLSLLDDISDPGPQATGVLEVSSVLAFTDSAVVVEQNHVFREVTIGTWATTPIPSPGVGIVRNASGGPDGFVYASFTDARVEEAYYWTGNGSVASASNIVSDLRSALGAGDVLVLGELAEMNAALRMYEDWDQDGGPGMYFFGSDTNESNITVDLDDYDIVPYSFYGTSCAARHIEVAAGQESHPIFAGLDTASGLDLASDARTIVDGARFSPRSMPEGPPRGWTVLATWAAGDCFDGTPNAAAIVEYVTASGAPVILDGAANQETAYTDWSETRQRLLYNQLLYLAR